MLQQLPVIIYSTAQEQDEVNLVFRNAAPIISVSQTNSQNLKSNYEALVLLVTSIFHAHGRKFCFIR